MHAIRQKCRPKHQVLILKCYPRTTKGAVDVKPNSSELSYLLYYATTRRSKVQKVGAFLEKKTASDVWRARIGNVQVTLQILEALIEKAPRDLPLYASYVLKILHLILRSDDITMVESSIPTFEAFCEHHDGASLSADQEYLKQYEEIVRTYASFGSTKPHPSKIPPSAPVAMKWRVAGLTAIKSVASSDALASVAGRQLDVIMPVLLENLWTDNDDYLDFILHRAQMEEKIDTEKLLRRRTSIATVRTVETAETNPLALSGTTADADKLAEEDIGILAIQCLKQIFESNNRSQIRHATLSTIKFIGDQILQRKLVTDARKATNDDSGWATTVFIMISRWTPVQDRYVILVTAMETLVKSPQTEENLPQQVVLAIMIGSLLKSDINLIGLSVMDVLLGLIQHILRILQLGGAIPHYQQRDVTEEEAATKGSSKDPSPSTSTVGAGISEAVTSPSTLRKDLLVQLEQCIGDLATHVYYADQISDMISAILLRLKPGPQSAIPTPVAAIEDPETTSNVLTASANLVEDPNTDGFFSFDTAKITALSAIKQILLIATRKEKMSGAGSLGRNRVGVRVWDGTQWLLRDGDGRVRKAYVDALLTWLDREMTRQDLQAFEDKPEQPRVVPRNGADDAAAILSKRAVSNASHREKTVRPSRSTFLQLLHLAIYENALQYVDSEADVVLLHLLLVHLVNKLGVNAVKNGLPMIFRLQEDIQEAETMAKVRMGSICHGYFWALSEKFDFESSGVAREIQSEIIRRKNKGFWVQLICVPPVPVDQIGTPGHIAPHEGLPLHTLESESLKPFDDRLSIVELISLSYSETIASPSNSPPTSPGRSFSHPILSGSPEPDMTEKQLPEQTREQMLSEWSRESVMAGATNGSKTTSLNGSRAGTNVTGQPRNFLAVGGNLNNGAGASGTQSPHSHHQHHQHRSRPPSQAYGLVGGIGALHKLRETSGAGADSPAEASESSRSSITRVEQLKRVLSGQVPPSQRIETSHSNASSESMMSYDAAPSELSYDNRNVTNVDVPRRVSGDTNRSKSRDRFPGPGPLSSNPVLSDTENTVPVETRDEISNNVPPVPPLPVSFSLPGGFPSDPSQEDIPNLGNQEDQIGRDTFRTGHSLNRGTKNKGGQSFKGNSWMNDAGPVINLDVLLKGIETGRDGRKGGGTVVKPPY